MRKSSPLLSLCLTFFALYLFIGEWREGKAWAANTESGNDSWFYVPVRVLSAANLTETEIWQALSLDPESSGSKKIRIDRLGSLALSERVVSHPWIESVETNWQFYPLSVTIYIRERKPAFVASFKGDSWVVSRTGFPICKLDSIKNAELVLEISTLPRVTIHDDPDVAYSRSFEQRYLQAVMAIDNITKGGGMPFEIDEYEMLADGSLRVVPVDSLRVPSLIMFSHNERDVAVGLDRFRDVFGDLLSKGERAESIDLRFANQAVVNYRKDFR